MKENQPVYIDYSNTDSTKKQVTLRNPIGVWFSQLDGNREELAFYYCFSQNENDRHDASYRYYGDLPDGRHFGAYVFPSMTSWADFKDPPFTGAVIVEENGKMQTSTPAEQMHLQPDEHYFPTAIVASPSGKTLVWITEGELWSWHMKCREELFLTDDGEKETRFGGRKVRDARMQADGILAMNYELETLVIPAFVKQVEAFAFGCCENLKNLTIEGDLSRVTNWAEDAFDGCGCEEYYKQLRGNLQ